MRVTYIKTKDTKFDVPEYNIEADKFLNKFAGKFTVSKGMFIIIDTITDDITEYIIFADEIDTETFLSIFIKFDLLIEVKDITLEVKSNKCELPLFIKSFQSEDSEFNSVCELEDYLELHLSSDDILEKISIYGIDTLTEKDKMLL